MKKRVFALLLAVLILCPSYTAFAASPEDLIASPYYIKITSIAAGLTMPDTYVGRVQCFGQVVTRSTSDYIYLTVSLQQQIGSSWTTISSWAANGYKSVTIDMPDYVVSGYKYQVKVTASIYDSDGNLIETAYSYDSYNYY